MACAYCGSGDWEETNSIIGEPEVRGEYVSIDFLCICRECNRFFVTTEWFRNDDMYEPRELTEEEIERYGIFA